MNWKFLLLSGAFLLTASAWPGCSGRTAGYRIETAIKGCMSGNSLILASYNGTKTIPVDTLPCESGITVFLGTKPLRPGMYAIFIEEKGKIDFLVSDTLNQSFSLSVDAGNPLSTLSFDHSPENTAFTGYLQMISKLSELRQKMQGDPGPPDSLSRLTTSIKRLNDEVSSSSAALPAQFPGSLLALFLQTVKEPRPPQPSVPLMVTDKNRYMQEYYYRYMNEHYWDETRFSDPRLVSIPVYEEKLHFYFQQLVEPVPEMTGPALDKLLSKTEANKEVFQFSVKSLFRLYRESPIPALIPVSLYIAENFVLNKKELWQGDPFYDQVSDKVAKARLNPVGSTTTDLKLLRNTGEILRLSEIKARLTILYFFNPDCESCHPITDKLLPLYHKYKDQGVEVYAVYLDRKTEIWKQYITSKKLDWINVFDPSGEEGIESKYDIYAIPMIYLLDKDKKILARDVPVEQLEDYLQK